MNYWETSPAGASIFDFTKKSFLLAIFAEVFVDVQFASRVVRTHVTNGAKNGALGSPGAIIAAQAPKNSAVGIRIAAIEGVAVIQFDQDFEGLLRSFRPFENFLAPEHTEVIVHAAGGGKLALGGVPQWIVGASHREVS